MKFAIQDQRSEYDYVQKETYSVFQPRKYLCAFPRQPERKITENDGLPQQVCLRCCAKLDFACDFFEDCHNVQQEFAILTSQDMATAINQRYDVRIEDEGKNKDKDENEKETNKENIVPIVKKSINSKIIRKSRPRPQIIKKNKKNTTPLKEQVQNIITTNALHQKASNDLSEVAACDNGSSSWPVCKSQIMIVKEENVDSEKTSSHSHQLVETSSKNDDVMQTPIENSQSNDSRACQESKKNASCIDTMSGDQESKVESDSMLNQTTNINSNDVSFVKIFHDGDMKTAIASPVPVQSDSFILEKLHEKEQTNVQDEASCVSKENKTERKSTIKISQLMSEEQKRLIETSYTINLSLMKYEVQNKMTVLSKDNINCNICGANYSRPDKCKVHIMSHLKIKPYECIKCDYTTVTVSNIRAHIRKSHLKIKPYVCEQCDKCYPSMVLLQEHINIHTGERPFKCQICGTAYGSRQGLNCHYKTHKQDKDIKCDICPKMFKSTARKRAHMLIHNKENMIQCTMCKNYLSNKISLDQHLQKVHSQKYICNICNKEMLSKKDLYNHKNVHMKAKHQCSLCSKCYKSKHILKEHILKHEGIRKYKCNDCGKTFAQQSHLAAHSATHSSVRFSCSGCWKQFNRRDNMKTHTKRCQFFLHMKDILIPEIDEKCSNTRTENKTEDTR
ncbi:zinc finger protein ZFP69-like [Harpegnathos saltator]|uniref:zinc finger protein ZFP69-like n=1 Tax=Harpegnathos saltator TaxID=610380 RepID=UPI0009489463|nr:zinc finger protein ZFP69-like [Harpegnathos saltator]